MTGFYKIDVVLLVECDVSPYIYTYRYEKFVHIKQGRFRVVGGQIKLLRFALKVYIHMKIGEISFVYNTKGLSICLEVLYKKRDICIYILLSAHDVILILLQNDNANVMKPKQP